MQKKKSNQLVQKSDTILLYFMWKIVVYFFAKTLDMFTGGLLLLSVK